MKKNFLLGLMLVGLIAAADVPPDLIVAEAVAEGSFLALTVQNQGPGEGKGRFQLRVDGKSMRSKADRGSVEIEAAVPSAVFGLETLKIPLSELGVTDPGEFDLMVHVRLDPARRVREANPGNNEYWKQISIMRNGRVVPPERGDYRREASLPDLVITDVISDGRYLKTVFKNQGKGCTGGDFLIRTRVGERSFDGNYYYRYRVPGPGKTTTTGGLTPGKVGLSPGMEATVTVEIDWEGRVRESNEQNNRFVKKLRL